MQRISLYTILLLLSMSCSLELPENTKSLKTCIKATGITATTQSTTTPTLNLSINGTTSDIAKVVWIVSQNSTEYYRSSTITSSPFSLTTPTLPTNGAVTITAQIVDKCGMNYNLTLNIAISNGAILMLLPVEGGAFQMGNSTTGRLEAVPVHLVILSGFNISKYEITQAQWKSVMGENPSSYSTNCDNCPVESVSWENVQLFLTKLNALTGKAFRLPTEAEWEYAASGGKLSKGYLYSGSYTVGDIAWYDANSDNKMHPVGQKTANELGVYDMSGNVWEWCQDWYGAYSANTQTNPTGPTTGTKRVLRGGSSFQPYWASQVAVRESNLPANRYGDLGFRVVLSQ